MAPRSGADGLLDDLMSARRELLSGRHATYHRLLGTLAGLISGPGADTALVASFERTWRTRSFPAFFERPLLILAALRADALQEGASHPLHGALAVDVPHPDLITPETLAAALGRDRVGIWSTMTTRRVQTNDTSRAIAWLWPAFLGGCDETKRPLVVADIGAGAGLNLIADRLPHIWSDQATNKAIPCVGRVNACARIGFDLRPLNVQNDDDVQWLRACIWVGDTGRLARFEASVKAMREALVSPSRPVIERLTASLAPTRLQSLQAAAPAGTLVVSFQTLVRGYLEVKELENYRKNMSELIMHQAPGTVLWVELELDDARRRLPAVLIAHVRAGDGVKSIRLGRMSQHPAEVDVDAAGVGELRRCLTGG